VTSATSAPARSGSTRSSEVRHRLWHAVWSSWPRRVVALAVVAGLGLRVAWIYYAARQPAGVHDPIQYLHLAQSLAHGDGYQYPGSGPTAYYPIGYPVILAVGFWIMQHSPWPDHWIVAAMGLNLFLSTAAIALAAVLGRRLVGPWVGAIAAVIVAFFPSLIGHSALILTETAFNFAFLLALVVLCWIPWSRRAPSWGRLVAFGVLFGIAIEIRPIALLVLPMVLIALWRKDGRRLAVQRFGVVVVAVLVVMAPWTIRNAVVMHAFLPIGSTTGDNLCIGNYPDAEGHFALPDWCFAKQSKDARPKFETDRNTRLTHRALEWAVHHPAREAVLIIDRTRWEFAGDADAIRASQSYGDDPFIPSGTSTVLRDLADWYFYAVVALAIVGVPLLLRGGDRRRLFLFLSIIGIVMAVWPFFGDPRFHVPINVLIPIPAAMVLVAAGRRVRPADGSHPDPSPT
jgi:4-amino-4-deoxy-L-arabinose transferase-like glycosyltransferase